MNNYNREDSVIIADRSYFVSGYSEPYKDGSRKVFMRLNHNSLCQMMQQDGDDETCTCLLEIDDSVNGLLIASPETKPEVTSNAPQASPTIQELLDEIFNEHTVALTSFTDDHGDTITDMDRVVIDVPKSKQAILTLFNRIITEARPEKQERNPDGEYMYCITCNQIIDTLEADCFCTIHNLAIDQFERNLRAAIEGKQPID